MIIPMSDEATKPRLGTYSFFFYGTLMIPAVIERVIGHPLSPSTTFQDALLPDYVRHHVVRRDYPGIVPLAASEKVMGRTLTQDEKHVRGTIVAGLSKRDAEALDVYEGDEYERKWLSVYTLSKPLSLKSVIHSATSPFADRQPETIPSIQSKISNGQAGYSSVSVWIYAWSDLSYKAISPEIWDFKTFLREKAYRWTTSEPDMSMYDRVEDFANLRVDTMDERTIVEEEVELLQEKKKLPKFGKGMLKYWQFDPEYTNLNHGSYGSPPLPVISSMHSLSRQVESNPDLFMRKSYLPLLNALRGRLAKLVNADVEDCVLVGNATLAVGTVLWNLDWKAGDVILGYSTTYNACAQSAKYICDKHPGLTYAQVPLEFTLKSGSMYACTLTHTEILNRTEDMLKKYNGGEVMVNGEKVKQRVKLVLVDAISSAPGIIMPWQGVADLCKRYGAYSLVDAAHEIGQLPVDLKSSKPDFWLSNCHKWLYGHRGCCLLYVNKDVQPLIRTSIPTSHFYESETYPSRPAHAISDAGEMTDKPKVFGGLGPFAEQWEWVGTQDWTPFLSMQAALDFRESLGGEKRIMQDLHSLALEGGKAAAKILGTGLLENEAGEFTACMVNILLMPVDVNNKALIATQLKTFQEAQFEAKVFSAVYAWSGALWARMSAQAWVEVSDFELVAEKLARIRQSLLA